MQLIGNAATQDQFVDALTLEDDAADSLTFVIANASVFAKLRTRSRGGGAREPYSSEVLLTPQTNQIRNVNGAQFRSAVAGSPARVVAQLTGPDDPQLAGGTPFTGQLQASGQVIVPTPSLYSSASTADLALTAASQVLTGSLISFSIQGANARIMAIGRFDLDITVAGVGLCQGLFIVDGATGGAPALHDAGGGVGRDTVIGTYNSPLGAGPHTIQMVALKSLAGGTAFARNLSSLALLVVDA